MSRRVVVTGVGLLSSVGIGTEATWQGVLAGKSGIGPITAFDARLFSCRIAGEVQGFDPARYIEKKEIKKMGRFIQFAIAASDYAIGSAGLRVDPDEAENVGVYIGSGIGGFEVIEREHQTRGQRGDGVPEIRTGQNIFPRFAQAGGGQKLGSNTVPAASPRSSFRRPSSTWLPATSPSAPARKAPTRPPPPPALPAPIPSEIRTA